MTVLGIRSTNADESNDDGLLRRLRAGDEHAFLQLVERHHGSMLRVAIGFVRTRALAEEVVQDAWLGVVSGLADFERRSSLKSWIYRILVNCAKTRGHRERRSVPMSGLRRDFERAGLSVEEQRFVRDPRPHWAG